MLGKLVGFIEIEICKHLTREIANWHSDAVDARPCQVIIFCTDTESVLTVDDFMEKQKQIFILDDSFQDAHENIVIDAIEIFADIHL